MWWYVWYIYAGALAQQDVEIEDGEEMEVEEDEEEEEEEPVTVPDSSNDVEGVSVYLSNNVFQGQPTP